MLEERRMVTAKKMEDGQIVTGYYWQTQGYDCETLHLVHDISGGVCEDHVVDPDTVKDVAVPISAIPHPTPGYPTEYRCPNCNAWFNEIRRVGDMFYGSTPYCGNCGQRLDWSVTQDDES